MQITSYTSSKEIINNFYRNTQYSESINYSDMAYWIYECLELIRIPLQYIPKITGVNGEEEYNLTDYRIKLPSDFHKLVAITVDGYMCVPSTDLFHASLDGSCCDNQGRISGIETFYDNFGNTYSPQALPFTIKNANKPPTFSLNNSYVTFDVKEGKVCMAYFAFPLDEEGYPLIPDDVKYKMACSSYLQYKMDYIMWRGDLINNNVYLESKNQMEWDLASCINKFKMPDELQMESLRQQMTKMVVRTEDFQTAFKTLNSRGAKGRY